MTIEIGRGLAEARALADAHWQALLVYAALGVVFPFLLLSSDPIFSLRNIMAIVSDPSTNRVGGSITGPLYLLGIVAVITAGAMLAAWNAILAEMREGYISELMYGMVAGTAYLVTNIMLAITIGLVTGLRLAVVDPETLASGGTAVGIGLEIFRVLLSLVGAWIGVRLCLAGAIMGGRGKLEPLSAFVESWRLTRPAQWRLYGFYLLYGLIFAIPMVGLAMLHGAIIFANEPGGLLETLMSFGWILLFALYFLGQVLIPAGLYRTAEIGVAAREIFA
ncbi:hypothetical protein EEB18_009840 [Sphingopyxis sp. OPL5]|uniref:hypothetical protein n=1 Tax=Sphingopyxis sp. OPL5 TaxID=2486273 RepID=UPI00164E4F6F|nr:hypothetical protein [Sphingopyxis sp. OPL5]QNO29201.1 hypothetical protein EEB18_009840 [Sphingopyxis sp. OPL5]